MYNIGRTSGVGLILTAGFFSENKLRSQKKYNFIYFLLFLNIVLVGNDRLRYVVLNAPSALERMYAKAFTENALTHAATTWMDIIIIPVYK